MAKRPRVEAEHLVVDGYIINMPADAADVRRYYQMYGEPTPAVRGKMTNGVRR